MSHSSSTFEAAMRRGVTRLGLVDGLTQAMTDWVLRAAGRQIEREAAVILAGAIEE